MNSSIIKLLRDIVSEVGEMAEVLRDEVISETELWNDRAAPPVIEKALQERQARTLVRQARRELKLLEGK